MSDTFDPTRHFTKISGKDYLPVQWRLVWLRDRHPLAQVETALVQHQNGLAVFSAKVTLPPQPFEMVVEQTGEIVRHLFSAHATGYGMAEAKEFGDYLEKAETKALGRALAALGFGTQFTDDYDDQPQQRSQPRQQQGVRQGPAVQARVGEGQPAGNPQQRGPWQPSDSQVKFVHGLMNKANLASTQRDDVTKLATGKTFAQLGGNQDLNKLIDYLREQEGAEWIYDDAGNLERVPF